MTERGMTRNPGMEGSSAGADRHGSAEVWAPRLARVLDRQREVYERLESLSLSQAGLIQADETDRLLDVLGERQRLIEQLGALNEELAPFTERWGELAPRLSEPMREELRRRFDDVSRLVGSIAERDEADRCALEARRGAVGRELEMVSRGRGALSAYARSQGGGPESGSNPRYQDRHG